MVEQVLDVATWILLPAGSFFVIVGGLGLIRMPDVFTRMHAASVTETVGGILILLGLLCQTSPGLTMFKLIVIIGIIFFTGPVVTHALAQAADQSGIDPILYHDRTAKFDEQQDGEK